MTVYLETTIKRFVGLSTDTKPSDAPVGSLFFEGDSGTSHKFIGLYYASGVLSVTEQPEAGDTIDIGDYGTYTFVDEHDFNSDGEIAVGATLAESIANIVAAINGTDGVNTANAEVTAEDIGGGDIQLTAQLTGTDGNLIGTVYTPFHDVENAFAAATLAGGYDEWTEVIEVTS